MLPLEDDVCVKYLVEGETLVVRRVLNSTEYTCQSDDDSKDHLENIFHMRCHVQNKICSLIIDGDSYTNVASTKFVKKTELAHYQTSHTF